jgi:hypothetical protein
MRLTTSFTAAAAAGLLALGLAASAPAPAHAAVRPALGGGWNPAQLHAEYGNGCAVPSSDTRLAPIISSPCGSWTWEFRYLTANPVDGSEEYVELVDPSGSYALGFSGGKYKLETPDANTTFVVMGLPGAGFSYLANNEGMYGMTPKSAGVDVGTDGGSTDAWELYFS